MITVTDLFCGAGGSSSGLASLPGVRVVMAANHWKLAIESHQENHPDTDHSNADLSQVMPSWFPTTTMLWASPECTNHSVAKGVKRQRVAEQTLFETDGIRPLPDDAAVRSRATMWDVPRFAEYHHYKAIIVENVVDARKWVMFDAWLLAMTALGYEHQIVWLNSMHAQALGMPAPQSRDRMYVVFWLKGNRKPDIQKWTRPRALCNAHGIISAVQSFKKKEQWGRYKAQYVYRCPKCAEIVEPGWLPAESIIDFTNRGQRIGDRKKPLSPKTMTRIQKGIERYWTPVMVETGGNDYDSTDPKHRNYGKDDGYLRSFPVIEPLRTQSGTASRGIATPPFLAQFRERDRTLNPAEEPLTTVVADGANHGLIVRGEGNITGAKPTSDPIGAITAAGSQFLLVPVEGREGKNASPASEVMRTQSTRAETGVLITMRGENAPKSVADALDTIAASGNHHALLLTNNHENRARGVDEPLPTATTATTQALLMRNNTARGDQGQMSYPVSEAMRTVMANGPVQSLIMRNNSGGAEMTTPASEPFRTLTTGGHQSLLNGPVVDVEDCEFRMLTPQEIKLGMAFTYDYILLGNKREQVKQSGNAVTPPAARDLGAAVIESLGIEIEMVAA